MKHSAIAKPLPAWCRSGEGRKLLDAVLDERPHYRVTKGGWLEGGGQRRYQGKAAAALRRYHAGLLDEALRRDDNDFHHTGTMGQRFAELNEEAPDKLIGRLLIEPARHVLTNRALRIA